MATTTNRVQSQYSGDVPSDLFIRDVSEWPKLITRQDTPLTKTIKHSQPLAQPKLKVEWGRSSPDPITDTLVTGINSAVTAVTPTNIGYYMVNHVIQMDNEKMLVAAVGASDLTVIRGFAGTTAAAHVNTALLNGIRILGIATKENAESPLGPITQGEVDYNYFQLFDEMVQFSHRARVTPTYEVKGDRMNFEIQKKLENTFPQLCEQTLLWGTRALGSTTSPSAMGGVFTPSFNYTNVDAGAAPFTEYMFLEAIQQAYNQVGSSMVGKTVMCHPFYKRIFASFANDARRISGTDNSYSNVIDEIQTDFGTFKFMMNYLMTAIANPALPDGRMLIFDPEDFELIPYDSQMKWGVWAVYEGGAYNRRAIRGDYSLRAAKPEKRVAVTNLSTTPGDYAAFLNS